MSQMPSSVRVSGLACLVALALSLSTAEPARAVPPTGLGPFHLRVTGDSLVAAATAPGAGYSLELRRESMLSFLPADSAGAEVVAELAGGRVSMLRFTYPGWPAADDFARVEQALTERFGDPTRVSEPDSARRVEWQSDWGRAVLEAGFRRTIFQPMTAKFFDLSVFAAATDSAAAQTSAPAKKPHRSHKKKSRTTP